MANIWGVDNDALDDGNQIRSSIGIGIDWWTPVGPLNFSFAQPITKATTDTTETPRQLMNEQFYSPPPPTTYHHAGASFP